MSLPRSNGFRPTLEALEDRCTPSVILAKIPKVIPAIVHQVVQAPHPTPKPVINRQPPYIFNPMAPTNGGFNLQNNGVIGTSNGFTLQNNAVLGTSSGFTLKNNGVIGTSKGFGTPVSSSQSSTSTTTTTSAVPDATQATQDLINALSQPFTFGVFPSTTK